MRKILITIAASLSFFNLAFAQQHHILSPQNAVAIPYAYPQEERVPSNESTARWDNSQTSPQIPISHGIDAVTSTQIGASQNFFSIFNNAQDQIFALPNVGTNGGTVSFLFKKKVSNCGGSSSQLMYNLSEDGGTTWLSTANANGCIGLGPINPQSPALANSPSQCLFIAPNNEMRMAYAGIASAPAGSAWTSDILLGLAKDLSTTPVILQEHYTNTGSPKMYRPSNIVQRGNLYEFWFVVGYGPMSGGDSALDVWKGVYSPTLDNISWNLQQQISLLAAANQLDGFRFTQNQLTFSPDGMHGCIAMLGDLVGGKDSVYLPIMMDFDANTQTFSAPYEILAPASGAGVIPTSTAIIDSAEAYLATYLNPSGQQITHNITFSGMDISMNNAGVPLLLCTINPCLNSVNSDPPYVYYPGFGARVLLITKDALGYWKAAKISDIYRYVGDVGQGVDKVEHPSSPYISRSLNGEHFFFHWTDGDTAMPITNEIPSPNLIGCSYNSVTQQRSDTSNWTLGDVVWGSLVFMAKCSQNALQSNVASCEYQIPTVALRYPDFTLANAPALPVEFHYYHDVHYCIDSANTVITWFNVPNNVGINTAIKVIPLRAFPNPTDKLLNLQYQTQQFSPSTIQLVDMKGQIVYQTEKKGMGTQQFTINVQAFAKGLYLLKVNTKEGMATQKIAIE
ncbi:MAG: T9SS type A sorting domain-containing protein [Ferruginibacter sp.]